MGIRIIVLLASLLFSWQVMAFSLSGEIKIATPCKGDLYHLWVSDENTQIFSLDLHGDSSFEFNLTKGTYRVTAISKRGCVGYKDIKLGANKSINLTLSKQKRSPADIGPIYPWHSPAIQPLSCHLCAYGQPSYNMFPKSSWWNTYSRLSYTNSHHPTVMNNWGINRNYFSASGHAGFGKPQLYHNVKSGKHWVEIDIPEQNKIASLPKLQKDQKVQLLADGKFSVDSNIYPYLFYDFSVDESQLQLKKGFCGNKIETINEMLGILETLNFPQGSVEDFFNYWHLKLPEARSYCVYPQRNGELKSSANLTASKNLNIIRCNFLVVLNQQCEENKALCNPEPMPKLKKASKRNSEALFEWGVGFYFN